MTPNNSYIDFNEMDYLPLKQPSSQKRKCLECSTLKWAKYCFTFANLLIVLFSFPIIEEDHHHRFVFCRCHRDRARCGYYHHQVTNHWYFISSSIPHCVLFTSLNVNISNQIENLHFTTYIFFTLAD